MEEKQLICIVGVLDVEGSTNIPMAASLLNYDFGVIPINYRSIIHTRGMKTFERYLMYIMKRFKPYLTIFSKCNGINPEIVKECSKYSKTWLYNMDPRKTIEMCPEVIQHAINTDFSSCTGNDVADWFMENGVKECMHLVQGVDQVVFKPVCPVDEFKADISFIGGKTPERDKYKKCLEDAGFNVKFYGNGYSENEIINKQFAEVCASSKFMLSLNTYNNEHTEYFSNRLVRYLGCGVCVLHLDETGTLNKYFEDGKDVLYFSDEVSLLNHLNNIEDEKAGRIALCGRARVLGYFTWDIIIGIMLKIVKENYDTIQ